MTFQIGDEVFSRFFGYGKIKNINTSDKLSKELPIIVRFVNQPDIERLYTTEGYYFPERGFNEYSITKTDGIKFIENDSPLNSLASKCHAASREKGFWPENRSIPECVALIHSELSEFLEELRKTEISHDSLSEEMADVLIRCFDLSCHLNIDLDYSVAKKMEKNSNRPMKHGKRF